MAYELHITKPELDEHGLSLPIPLEDWKSAVSAIEGVRLCPPGEHTATNPKTGAVISMPRRDGDAEVYFPAEQAWHAVFRWFEGSANFAARFQPGDLSHPVWAAAVALASRLGVVIRGDEGEIYDLQTGEPVA
jgi:hypothetical protein